MKKVESKHQWNIKILLHAIVLVFYCPECSAVSAFLRVLVGSDVTLQCLSAKLPRLQDLSGLTVEWSRENRHFSRRQTVYTFEDGQVQVSRAGAEVDRVGLLQSDASLTLHNVTVGDEGEYSCRIITPVVDTLSTTLEVLVEPSFLQISSIPQIPKVQRLLVLCCRVENFYPPDVYLEWSRNDGEPVHPTNHFGPFSDYNYLYSMWSKIQLTMATEDESAVYTCRVYHSSFTAPGYRDALYHINTQGTPPNVMFIDCEPLCPVPNTECTLHLCVRDFCPKHVTVTWTKDGQPVDSGSVFNTPPSLNINGLYSMYSFLKLTPSQAEWSCCYRCQVEHSAQSQPEEREFTLGQSPGS